MSYDGYTKYDAKVARAYDDDRRAEEHWQAEQAYVSTLAARQHLGRVLDMPVGTGRFLELLRDAHCVAGADISLDMLSVAEERRRSLDLHNAVILRADGMALPFPDKAFDTVLCFRLVHLLPPELIGRLLAELARVCAGIVHLQVYVAPERTPGWRDYPWLKPALDALRRLRDRRERPWSHIRSYAHSASFLESSAAAASLVVHRRHSLGDYAGSAVEVLELGR